jgi:hypothetical protein
MIRGIATFDVVAASRLKRRQGTGMTVLRYLLTALIAEVIALGVFSSKMHNTPAALWHQTQIYNSFLVRFVHRISTKLAGGVHLRRTLAFAATCCSFFAADSNFTSP